VVSASQYKGGSYHSDVSIMEKEDQDKNRCSQKPPAEPSGESTDLSAKEETMSEMPTALRKAIVSGDDPFCTDGLLEVYLWIEEEPNALSIIKELMEQRLLKAASARKDRIIKLKNEMESRQKRLDALIRLETTAQKIKEKHVESTQPTTGVSGEGNN
jgi:hypothetical protein